MVEMRDYETSSVQRCVEVGGEELMLVVLQIGGAASVSRCICHRNPLPPSPFSASVEPLKFTYNMLRHVTMHMHGLRATSECFL